MSSLLRWETPTRRGDGHADLSYVYAAAKEIAEAMEGYTVVVTKSTVPVGTGDEVERIIRETRPDADFDVVSNPEFLREGSAIEDFMRPDRVVIGTESERAQDVMRQLYRPLFLIETPILFTQRRTSELIKYAANTFLAAKITFINEIADLCEKVGADVQAVSKGIGLDGRIGKKFLHAGPGYGGSCFPKDTLALVKTAQDYGSPLKIIETVVEVNAERKKQMATKVIDACGGSVEGKKIAILGVAFNRIRMICVIHQALILFPLCRLRAQRSAHLTPKPWVKQKRCCLMWIGRKILMPQWMVLMPW